MESPIKKSFIRDQNKYKTNSLFLLPFSRFPFPFFLFPFPKFKQPIAGKTNK